MSAKLYQLCTICGGTGCFRDGVMQEHECCCKLLRVAEVGLSVEQAEMAVRELTRARLRMATLERELKQWYERAFEGRQDGEANPLGLQDVLTWLSQADRSSRLQVMRRAETLLAFAAALRSEAKPAPTDPPGPKGA